VLRFYDIKQALSNLFFRGENYVVIEILNHYVQVTLLSVSHNKKKIRIVKNYYKPVRELSVPVVLDKLKSILRKIRKLEKYKVVLSLDSDLATTIYAHIPLVRPHPKEIINEADLDNIISQAIWRFFDRNRFRVSKKLEIDEIDVLLSDVRIRGIKLDGHKVVNPVGFKAKSVEVSFSQTLAGRELMKGIRELISKDKIELITETGTAMSHVLSKALRTKDKFFVANLFPNHTAIFVASNNRVNHHNGFNWGEKDLHESLADHFAVDPVTARMIIQKHSEQKTSKSFQRRFENILHRELQIFANGIGALLGEDNPMVYLNPYFNAPPIIYSSRFQSRLEKPFKVSPLSTNIITEKMGYDVQYNKTLKVRNLFSVLSSFFEINFLPQNSKMSHLANRRVRWLIN